MHPPQNLNKTSLIFDANERNERVIFTFFTYLCINGRKKKSAPNLLFISDVINMQNYANEDAIRLQFSGGVFPL